MIICSVKINWVTSFKHWTRNYIGLKKHNLYCYSLSAYTCALHKENIAQKKVIFPTCSISLMHSPCIITVKAEGMRKCTLYFSKSIFQGNFPTPVISPTQDLFFHLPKCKKVQSLASVKHLMILHSQIPMRISQYYMVSVASPQKKSCVLPRSSQSEINI